MSLWIMILANLQGTGTITDLYYPNPNKPSEHHPNQTETQQQLLLYKMQLHSTEFWTLH